MNEQPMTPGQAMISELKKLGCVHSSDMILSNLSSKQIEVVAQAAIAASGRDKLVDALKEIIDLGPPFGAQTIVARAALAPATAPERSHE